jgi:hypothetical protein
VARAYWIWFVGAVIWWCDAALALHFRHLGHALLALGVSALFFLAGVVFMKMPPRRR